MFYQPALFVGALVTMVACSDSGLTPDGTAKGFRGRIGDLGFIPPPTTVPRTLDDDFADLGRRIPGFAGVWYDNHGRPTAGLTTLQSEATARTELDSYFREQKVGHRANRPERLATGSDLRFQLVSYDFLTLKEWYDDAVRPLLSVPGVNVTDIDELANKVRIESADSSIFPHLRLKLAVAGVPAEAIMLVQREPERLRSYDITSHQRPVVAGLAIYSWSPCSHGVNVRMPYDDYVQPYFFTASHCSTTTFYTEGAVFYQPNQYYGRVGWEVWDQGYFTGGGCPAGRHCRWSDATLIQYDSTSMDGFPYIAFIPDGNWPYSASHNIPIIGNGGAPLANQWLARHGVGSGISVGQVSCTNVVYNDPDSAGTVLISHRVDASNDGGDSGGPVYQIIWSEGDAVGVNIYGLLFAGDGDHYLYSGIGSMQSEYGAFITY